MHPSVKVSVEEYEKGQTQCPICNMNLIPVTETVKEESMSAEHMARKEAGQISTSGVDRVTVPVEQLERAGVQSEVIRKRTLCKTIRTVGQIAYDPDMLIAQEELISALKSLDEIQVGASPEIIERAQSLVESSKRKLRLLGLSDEQIEGLTKTRKAQEGLVLPEDKMWVYGDIYEYEIGWVSPGRNVMVMTESFPGEKFNGTISAIDPVVNPKTRSVKFRAEIDNPELKLKPQMYVDVEIQGICINEDGEDKVPAVPKDSIIDTGARKVVWIDMGGGVFEGREVEAGMEGVSLIDGDGRKFYPVFSGVKEGEKIVTKGNFLIDSQSQISGTAAAAYGGALGEEGATVHQH
jgi:multidrug efflux pump subunit AcrA (membrane-fusion protein)